MARIGIDLDGVCYDFAGSLRAHLTGGLLSPEAALEAYPEATRWEFYEDWGLSLGQFLDACDKGVDAGVVFRHGEPYPGVGKALLRLTEAGHELHAITDRSFGAEGASELATNEWLDKHLPDVTFSSITFTADKTVVPVAYMIDDKIENYDALDDAGVMVYLLDRPWNQEIDERFRVESLDEFVDKVLDDEDLDNEDLDTVPQKRVTGVDEVRTVSATGGEKGQKQARLGSIDPQALLLLAEVAGFGEQKYSRLNYLRGYDWSLSFDAKQRHDLAFWSGQDLDPESGLPHLAHSAWHALALLAFHIYDIGTDDRYRPDEQAA